MLCIVPAADAIPGRRATDSWKIPQVFEFIALRSRRVDLLVIVIAESLSDSPQHLNIAHRGGLDCRLIDLHASIRFPSIDGFPVRKALSHRIRSAEGGHQFRPRVDRFTLCDDWEDIVYWDRKRQHPVEILLPVRQASPSPAGHRPYTALRIGPFEGRGKFAIGIEMSLSEHSYELLLGDREFVMLKGVRSVLSHIQSLDLPTYEQEGHSDSAAYRAQFQLLSDCVVEPEAYEIFVDRLHREPPFVYVSGAPSVLRAFEAPDEVTEAFDHFVARASEFSVGLELRSRFASGSQSVLVTST